MDNKKSIVFWLVVSRLNSKGIIKEGTHYEFRNGLLYLRVAAIHQQYEIYMAQSKLTPILTKGEVEKHLLKMEGFVGRRKTQFADKSYTWSVVFFEADSPIYLEKVEKKCENLPKPKNTAKMVDADGHKI